MHISETSRFSKASTELLNANKDKIKVVSCGQNNNNLETTI
jgi:hypothetical protein